MKHIFILNPAAGKENAKAALESQLQTHYATVEYEIYETQGSGDAVSYIRNYCNTNSEPVRFYACGGDRTLNEVVNGAVGFSHASVGCYPCGSGNDFVKYYGGKEIFLDLSAQLEAEEEEIDLIRVGDRYAVNAAHFGFDSCVAQTMTNVRRKKLIGGKNAYTTGILVGLVKAMRNKCKVTVDGTLLNPEGTILLCTLANGQYVGGSFRCAPRSVNNDGLIEVCLVKPVSHLKFVSLMNYYKKGTHLSDPKFEKVLTYCRGSRIEVEAPEGFVYCLDGELITENRFTVEVAHKALRFAVPKGAKPIVDPQYLPKQSEEEEAVLV